MVVCVASCNTSPPLLENARGVLAYPRLQPTEAAILKELPCTKFSTVSQWAMRAHTYPRRYPLARPLRYLGS